MRPEILNTLLAQKGTLYALLDGALVPGVAGRPLFDESAAEEQRALGPHLLSLDGRRAQLESLLADGWGRCWGVYCASEAPSEEIHRHFASFLTVRTEQGEEFYFRFYDPRVLRVFLPTCDEAQRREFFGPVSAFVVEDEDPARCLVFDAPHA